MKSSFMKKGLSLGICTVMLAGLVACGDNRQQENVNTAGAEGETTGEIAGGGESVAGIDENTSTEISWFSTVSGWGTSANWANGVTSCPLMDAIYENTGATLNFEMPATDAETKLGLMIASRELPDVITATGDDIINQLIASGLVWDLNEFFETYAPDSYLATQFPEDIKAELTKIYNGWYAIPSHILSKDAQKMYPPTDESQRVDSYSVNAAIMFNETLMKELDIKQEDVQTETKFFETLEKVKNSGYQVNGETVIPVMLDGTNWINSSMGTLANNFGAVRADEEGKYRSMELSPGYKKALEFTNRLVRNGYLDINSLTIDTTAKVSYVESGRVFCWIGNPADTGNKEKIPLTSFGPILADNGAVPTVGVEMSTPSGWLRTFVSKSCKNPELVAKMLNYGCSSEGMFYNEWGVEGEDYTIDENGIVTMKEEGLKRKEEQFGGNWVLWAFSNTAFYSSHALPSGLDTDLGLHYYIASAMCKYEDTYLYDSSLYNFTTGTVLEPSGDLGIAKSQIDNYLESQKAKIVSASSEAAFEEEYNNMIETLQDYGIAKIDAEYDKVFQKECADAQETVMDVNAALYQ